MTYLRICRTALVVAVGLFALLVGFNNITDYQSNFLFVQHVMSMDTTFPDNRLMWRAITHPALHHLAYWLIIACELAVGVLCIFGSWHLWQTRAASAADFNQAKKWATFGLTLGVLLWFTGFMTVGAEWFVMWQSDIWNGQQAAFRFIAVIMATLIFLHQKE